MMGGTGIAEVALPIDERLRALRDTERAAAEHGRARRARSGGGGGGGGGGRGGEHGGIPPSSSSSSRARGTGDDASLGAAMVCPSSFAPGPAKRRRRDASPTRTAAAAAAEEEGEGEEGEDPSLPRTFVGVDRPADSSSSAMIVGPSAAESDHPSVVRRSDLSGLGASYSHNFQLHTKEWVMRKRDERQTEIDAVQARQEVDEGPTIAGGRARVGFEMARKLARGEAIAPVTAAAGGGAGAGAGGGKGPNGELRNEWDRKSGDNRSSDDRVWKTFMTNQRNRR
jgi:hypothetical protein